MHTQTGHSVLREGCQESWEESENLLKKKNTQMTMGCVMGPAQPNLQTAGPSGSGKSSETVPDDVLEVWASLSRRERQRSRRRYFRAKSPRAVDVFPIDACIATIECALAEFLHVTAASLQVPPARSSTKRAREDADLPSPSTPASNSEGISSEVSRAEGLVLRVTHRVEFCLWQIRKDA